MTYRDDHDAALARVDALEREVAELRADDATQADRITYLEESLADARRAAERAQAALAKLRPQPTHKSPEPALPPLPPIPDAGNGPAAGVTIAVGIALVMVALVVVGVRNRGRAADATIPPPDLASKPQSVLPATVDPTSRLIDEAIHERLAAKLPGGFLEKITITELDESGVVHPEYDGQFRIQFERHAHPTPQPARPIGAPPPPDPGNDGYECLIMSRMQDSWVDLDLAMLCHDTFAATHDAIDPPRCTPSAIWKLARADGAPAGALASLAYDGGWHFEIADPRAPFDHRYVDNCTPP